MAGKKRTDSKGRILRNGEMQRAEDNRYLYRYIDLSGKKWTVYAVTLVELREKEKQNGLHLLLGKAMRMQEVEGISDFVFTNTLGRPYAVNAVNSALDNIIKAYNKWEGAQAVKERRGPELLPHISAHILRNTACTRLAESGLEPKVLQYIVGHANVSVTLDIYTHLDFTKIQEKMEAVQENMRIG